MTTIPQSVFKPFPWPLYISIGLGIAFLVVWPLASVIFTSSMADVYGCSLADPSAPCMAGDKDWGPLLHTMSRIGWLVLPFGLIAFLVWGVALAFHLRSRRQELSSSS